MNYKHFYQSWQMCDSMDIRGTLKQGQTVHMLQLFWIYILLARLYIYIYIHIYTYTNIYTYIFTCSTLKFFDNIFIEDAMPEKAL